MRVIGKGVAKYFLGLSVACAVASGCEGPATDPDVVVGPAGPVTGVWKRKRVNARGETIAPLDLSQLKIGVHVSHGQNQQYLPGAGNDQGEFTVPDVPGGPFLLELRSTDGFPQFFASNGSVRTFDLSADGYGHADTSWPSPANTAISLGLTGLEPWRTTDTLLARNDVNASHSFSPVLAEGTTSTTVTLRYGDSTGIDGPTRGHETQLLQRGQTLLPGDIRVVTARAAVATQMLQAVNGQTIMAMERLQPLTADDVVSLDLRRAQFLPFRPSLAPEDTDPSVLVTVRRVPPGLDDIDPVFCETMTINAPAGPGDLQLEAQGSNHFPAAWTRIVDVVVAWRTSLFVPGAMRPVVVDNTLRFVDRADRVLMGPLGPRLAPVRAVRINGRPADESMPVGLAPEIVWDVPALGMPTLYEVSLRRLDLSVETVSEPTVTTVRTEQTRLQLPPGLLQRGSWYRLRIRAIAAEARRVASPNRESLPWAEASALTGRFTP